MNENASTITKDVLATIVYYDGLDYPLTAFEAWKYLMRADYCEERTKPYCFASLAEIMSALESEKLKEFIEEQDGFYFLKGKKELAVQRIERGKISAGKFKGLRGVARFLRFVPFVRMVGITGTLSMKNAEARSDWDVLVVLKSGHIWTGRLLVTLAVHIMGRRRWGAMVSDRVCLNYYITDETLEISTKDLFSANEYFFLFPLFGWKTYRSFQLRNLWIGKMKPHYYASEDAPVRMVGDSAWARRIRRWGERILRGRALERFMEKAQKGRIIRNPKTYKEGGLVRFSDEALVFLPSPHGPELFEKFKKNMGKMQI